MHAHSYWSYSSCPIRSEIRYCLPLSRFAASDKLTLRLVPWPEHIGVNHPAIVREIPHFDAFPEFLLERPAFLLERPAFLAEFREEKNI